MTATFQKVWLLEIVQALTNKGAQVHNDKEGGKHMKPTRKLCSISCQCWWFWPRKIVRKKLQNNSGRRYKTKLWETWKMEPSFLQTKYHKLKTNLTRSLARRISLLFQTRNQRKDLQIWEKTSKIPDLFSQTICRERWTLFRMTRITTVKCFLIQNLWKEINERLQAEKTCVLQFVFQREASKDLCQWLLNSKTRDRRL